MDSPLAKLFTDQKIRVKGDALNPLFCAKDVAAYIDDSNNYLRVMRVLKTPIHCVVQLIPGAKTSARVKLLTECGLYRYLMLARQPKAVEFQEFVCQLLIAERKRVISDMQLQAKIKQDEKDLRNEVLQQELNAVKAENATLKTENNVVKADNEVLKTESGAVKSEIVATKAAIGSLKTENSELKGSVQYYKQSSRTSDWLLTKKAPEAEEAFRRPDAHWTDLAKYYIQRANFESEKKLVKSDPADIDPRLQRIAQECFVEPTMWYDGYAIFLKKAQEIYEQTKRGLKPEKIYTIADVDPAVYAENLRLVRAARELQEAGLGPPRGW
jgi:prophage antirepressor-like protein